MELRSSGQTIEPSAGSYCWSVEGGPSFCADAPDSALQPTRRQQLTVGRGGRIKARLTTPAESVEVSDVDGENGFEAAGGDRRWSFGAHTKPGVRTLMLEIAYGPGTRAYYFRIKVVKRPEA